MLHNSLRLLTEIQSHWSVSYGDGAFELDGLVIGVGLENEAYNYIFNLKRKNDSI